MIGHELAVEQGKTGLPHPRDEPGERDLRRIRPAGEHALPEKGATKRHAIEATHQFPILPAFHGMREAEPVQIAVSILDLPVDPGRRAIGRRLRTLADDGREVRVETDREALAPDGLGQRMGQPETVQRQDRALLGLDPVDIARIAPVRHREDANGIGLKQQQRIDRHQGHTLCHSKNNRLQQSV